MHGRLSTDAHRVQNLWSVDAYLSTGKEGAVDRSLLKASLEKEGNPSVVVQRLFRNASLVGYLRFFVSQARVFVVLGVCPGTVWYRRVGPFVRDCEAERLFLCCIVRVGYWPDQPVVRSRVVASFFLTRALPLVVVRLTRALFFPHSLLSISPTFTLELLHEFRWLAGARGKAVVRLVAADQADNAKLERGVRGAFLGFRCDSRFFGSSIAFLSVVVRRLFRNASLVGYPRFFVSQARVFVVLGVCPGTVWYRRVGPFVRDCEAKRLFLCCVVRVGCWPDQPVVRSCVVASFFLTRALPLAVVREFVTRGRGICVVVPQNSRYMYPSWVTV
ncbi:hypothetical protein Taro_023058 [Colocasia esculenta]|uniref:Uncharacterized protein n=1 Tax=Colocasia esculenta TaxID=4460 RepID=A0A843VDB2_COLES|nr:hypothetical protein [Colocasia esculenta]